MASRDATTRWSGALQDGAGIVTMDSSHVGEFAVSFPRRTGDPDGETSPEEMIAAAQSSCLAMSLAGVLGSKDLAATSMDVSSRVTFGNDPAGGFAITGIEIRLRAEVPGAEADAFAEMAQTAKDTCPVSKALAGTEITLDAALT